MIFQQKKLGTTVIPHFRVILTGPSISDIIFMTLGQDQKVNFKVKQLRHLCRPNTSFS